MKLSQLPDGESVFLDANIFLYSAFDHPAFGEACRDFLVRVDREKVKGYCSAFVLNEVFHKLMMSEIVEKFGVHARAANSLFKQRPEIICELCDVWDEMDRRERAQGIAEKLPKQKTIKTGRAGIPSPRGPVPARPAATR